MIKTLIGLAGFTVMALLFTATLNATSPSTAIASPRTHISNPVAYMDVAILKVSSLHHETTAFA